MTSRNTHHSGFARSDAAPGDLRREDDAPFGGRLGAAARRLVARRRRQQQHVAVARRQHRRGQHDVLVDAQARPRRAPRAIGAWSPQRLEKVAADDPEQIHVAVARRARSSRPPSSPAPPAPGKPHAASSARASRRRGAGTQPTSAPPCTPEWPRIGTSPRSGRPASPRARPTLIERLDGVHAVRVLRQPHRPDEDRVRPRDQQIGERRRCARATCRSRARCDPSRPRPPARSASSKPVVVRATNALSMPPRSTSARSTPSRNARSPPVCTSNQWSASAVPSSALLGNRRNPVALEPGLAVRVHDGDLRRRSSWRGAGTSSSPAGCWRRSSRRAR